MVEKMNLPNPIPPPDFPGSFPHPAPPDLASIDPRLDLEDAIRKLKEEKKAVLLSHY